MIPSRDVLRFNGMSQVPVHTSHAKFDTGIQTPVAPPFWQELRLALDDEEKLTESPLSTICYFTVNAVGVTKMTELAVIVYSETVGVD